LFFGNKKLIQLKIDDFNFAGVDNVNGMKIIKYTTEVETPVVNIVVAGTSGETELFLNAEDHNFTPYFVYINGIQVAAEGREGANSAMTTARSMLNSNVPMIIGSDMATSGNPSETSYQDFPGEIDDVCFYSDTLTDEEVLRNYNAGKRSHK
jgi:hypothetical protein